MSSTIDVLIVEDDPGDVRLALEVLAELQMRERCIVLRSGDEALDFLRCEGAYSERAKGLPRVILADLKMPRLDGFDLLRILKRDPELQAIPVVVLSSSDERGDVERARVLGAHQYLVKGMDFSIYRAALYSLVEGIKTAPQKLPAPPGLLDRKG